MRWPRDWSSDVCSSDLVHIEVLYVRPEFRRRGIGQLLLKEIADWAALMRATHVACLPLPAARRARRYLAMMGLLPGVDRKSVGYGKSGMYRLRRRRG